MHCLMPLNQEWNNDRIFDILVPLSTVVVQRRMETMQVLLKLIEYFEYQNDRMGTAAR